MSIGSLRLKGFKSFGSPCDFTFNKGFTAIVGPNGSGKSNILDALRWILGEGSNAALRIIRQSDLLFQGSLSVPPAKEAEVSLTLEPDTGEKAVLKRVYTSEGGSSLLLDGKKILIQDLNSVKARFSLEGEGFAFIGQGEVSAAIHQRPRERRRQLDTLFGIDRYRDRRDDTLKRLESALSEVQRIQTLIMELEARRNEIADEVGVAVQAKGILDNLDVLRRDFYFSRRFTLEKDERSLRSGQQVLKIHLELAERWRALWLKAVRAGEALILSQGFDEPAFTRRAQELAARKDNLQRQAFQASTQIKTILENRVSLENEQKENSRQEQALKEELERAGLEEKNHREQLEKYRAELEGRLKELEEGRARFEREKIRRQSLQDNLAERQLFCSRAEAQLRALETSQEGEAETLEKLQDEERRRKENGEALVSKLDELESRHSNLADRHAAINAARQKYAADLQQARRDCARQEAELTSLRDGAESSLYPEPVRLLLSLSRSGRLKSRPEVAAGVFSCPSDIAPALDAYLGGRQSWLLVQTLEEAQEGIEILKQRRAGRATFLPLERCRPRDRDFRFKLPPQGVVGWCMDLIQVRSPWGPAIAHMAGDLLIVNGYELGSSLVKQGARFPIVTLDGDVFAPAGTVSGGQTRQRGSAIAHNQQIALVQAKLETSRDKVIELEKAFKSSEGKEQALASELNAVSSELERVRNEAAAEQRALKSVSDSVRRLALERTEAQERMGSLREELAAAQKKISELELEIAGLEDLAEADNPDSALAPLRAGLSLAEERLRGTRAILERIGREHKSLLARTAALESEIKTGYSDEASRRELLGAIGKERLALHNEEQELKKKLEEEQARVQRVRRRLERLRERSGRAEATVTERNGGIAAAAQRLASLESERHQLTELWDEKYPYDAKEAAEVEGGKDLTSSLRRLERELKALGPYNLGALSEDTSLMERIDFLSEQLEDIRNGADELKELIRETDAQVETSFTGAMREIDSRFNELFQRLFAGGEARLTLQEGESIWDRGVDIYARPPGKKLQNITQLSGGEQSLTAIAQLFSALEVAKVPLAVLDEVDAALDEYNLIRFADLAREYSQSLQLIVMTHRRTTMERADLIYGVTMVEPGLSRIVGIDVENYR